MYYIFRSLQWSLSYIGYDFYKQFTPGEFGQPKSRKDDVSENNLYELKQLQMYTLCYF